MKLARMVACLWLASGAAASQQRVDWVQLRGYNYKTGRINADAKSLDQAVVKIYGFMVPFDDEQSTTEEFLLVPQLGQCIHIPPPPPNQIVLVRMNDPKRAAVSWDKPVVVTGKMSIGESKSPSGRVLYRLAADKVDVVTGY